MSSATPQIFRFGNHEVLQGPDGTPILLGEGSFGKTYKARHIFLGTEAALKIIRPNPDSFDKARTQFLREARSAAQLRHPHIAIILDFGESEGALYYAMEFCGGGDLQRYIDKHGAFGIEAALPLFRQSASALLCAHERGFLHRDLKPSNFLFASEEQPLTVKLIDFGLVKEFIATRRSDSGETQDPVTETAQFAGTPLFASPEQLREEVLDERSDIFSLGMTWWFLITGKPPISGSTAHVVAERLRAADYAEQLPTTLPPSLHGLLASMLAKERSRRPANLREILKQLDEIEIADSHTTASTPQNLAIRWEPFAGNLLSQFKIEGPIERTSGGTIAPAEDAANRQKVWLLVFDQSNVASAEDRERIQKHAQALQKIESKNLLSLLRLVSADDGCAAVFAREPGVPLLDVLKSSGDISFKTCLSQLSSLATTLDTLESVGLPPVDITPHALIANSQLHQEGFSSSEACILILPALVEVAPNENANFDAHSSATMIVESGKSHSSQAFAALIYRFVSGRALNTAARIAPEAFVTVSALSEEGNRILSRAVLDDAKPISCSELLAQLCEAEGVVPGSTPQTTAGTPTTGGSRVGSLLRSSNISVALGPAASLSRSGSPLTSVAQSIQPSSKSTAPVPKKTKPAPKPPSQSPLLIPLILGLTALVGFGFIVAGLIFSRSTNTTTQPAPESRDKKITTATPPPPPAPTPTPLPAPQKAPPYFTFTGGIIPPTVSFKINGQPVIPELNDGTIRLPIAPAESLPVKIAIHASGYKEKIIEITQSSFDTYPDLIRLARASGEIAFTGADTSDYSEATFKMIEALPEEKGVRPEASPYTFPIKAEAAPKKLSTGIYEVILRGSDPNLVQPRKQRDHIEVREAQVTHITLPQTVTGTFIGQDPAGGTVEMTIDRDLRGGKITRIINSTGQTLTLGPARLNNQGVVTSETSPDPSGVVWRIELAMSDPTEKSTLIISSALVPPGQTPSAPVRIQVERR